MISAIYIHAHTHLHQHATPHTQTHKAEKIYELHIETIFYEKRGRMQKIKTVLGRVHRDKAGGAQDLKCNL